MGAGAAARAQQCTAGWARGPARPPHTGWEAQEQDGEAEEAAHATGPQCPGVTPGGQPHARGDSESEDGGPGTSEASRAEHWQSDGRDWNGVAESSAQWPMRRDSDGGSTEHWQVRDRDSDGELEMLHSGSESAGSGSESSGSGGSGGCQWVDETALAQARATPCEPVGQAT